MNDKDIRKIARLLTEDPDVISEEDELPAPPSEDNPGGSKAMSVVYTNIHGETNKYQILDAWPGRRDYQNKPATSYSIMWPNGTYGALTIDGFDDESLRIIEERAKANAKRSLANTSVPPEQIPPIIRSLIMRREYLEAKKVKNRKNKNDRDPIVHRGKWNYMFLNHGRCCPSWYYPGHTPAAGTCWQNDEEGRAIAQRAPSSVKDYSGTYDKGNVSIESLGQGSYEVSMRGENPRIISQNEMEEYLQELGINPTEDKDGSNYSRPHQVPETLKSKPKPKPKETIETDFGTVEIVRSPDGVEVTLDGEESIVFDDIRDAQSYLSDELGVQLENIQQIANVLNEQNLILEGVDANKIIEALKAAGYSDIQVPVPNDAEYHRVDIFAGGVANDKLYQIGDPETDVTADRMARVINRIIRGEWKELDDNAADEIEELQSDASLFITAAKKIGDKWVALSIMSLDKPEYQFDMPSMHDSGEISPEELEQMFNASSDL